MNNILDEKKVQANSYLEIVLMICRGACYLMPVPAKVDQMSVLCPTHASHYFIFTQIDNLVYIQFCIWRRKKSVFQFPAWHIIFLQTKYLMQETSLEFKHIHQARKDLFAVFNHQKKIFSTKGECHTRNG